MESNGDKLWWILSLTLLFIAMLYAALNWEYAVTRDRPIYSAYQNSCNNNGTLFKCSTEEALARANMTRNTSMNQRIQSSDTQ